MPPDRNQPKRGEDAAAHGSSADTGIEQPAAGRAPSTSAPIVDATGDPAMAGGDKRNGLLRASESNCPPTACDRALKICPRGMREL